MLIFLSCFRRFAATVVFSFFFSLITINTAQAASRYWVGSAGGNWNDTANWADADPGSCTGGGASVPASADVAYFDADCDNNATMNTDVNVLGINIASGYSGTISPSSAISITIGTTGYVQAGGTFTTTEGSLTLSGNFTKTGGTFNEGNGMVIFRRASAGATIDVATTETFYNVDFNATVDSAYYNITAGDTIVVTGTLTLTNGTVNIGTIDARGDIDQASTFDGGTATIDFSDNDLAQTYTINGGSAPSIRFNHDSDKNDSVVFAQDASVYGLSITADFGNNDIPLDYGTPNKNVTIGVGSFTQASGIFTAPASLTLSGNFTKTGGTFNEGTGTVIFRCPYNGFTINVDSTETFSNVEFNGTDNNDYYNITAGDTIVVAGTLTLTNGLVNIGTIDARGDIDQASTFDGGTAIIDFGDNDIAQTYTSNGGTGPVLRFDDPADANDSVIFTAEGSLYGLTIKSGFGDNDVPITYYNDTLTLTTGGFTQEAGTFTAPTNLTLSGNFTKTGGTFDEGTGTLTINGSGMTFNVDTSETLYNLIVNMEYYFRTVTITTGDTVIVAGDLALTQGRLATGTVDVRGNVIQSSGAGGYTATIDFGNNSVAQTYTINGGTGPVLRFDDPADANDSVIFTAEGSLYGLTIKSGFGDNDVPITYYNDTLTLTTGGFTQEAGTFTAPTNLTLSGNFTKTGGTFDEGTGTLTINGEGMTFNVDTSETFYNLIVNMQYNFRQVTITTGDTVVVTGELTMTQGSLKTGTAEIQGDYSQTANTYESTATLLFSGSAAQTFTTNNTASIDGDVIINKSDGQVNLVGNLTMNANSQDLIIQEGTLDLNGSNLTVTGGSSQTFIVQDGGTLRQQGGETISASTNYPEFQDGSIAYFDGASGPYTIQNFEYATLLINSADNTFNLPGNINVTNLIVSAGTLDATASDFNIEISGDLTVTAPGSINNRSNTVTFTVDDHTITGNITFHNFTAINFTGLIGYWKLDETTAGSTIVDSSGNGYDGTPQGISGTNNLPQPNVSVPSLDFTDLRSLNFDATDDYIGLPDMSASITTQATFSLWVKRATHTPTTQKNSGSWFWNTSNFGSIYPYTDGIIYDGTFRASRYTVGAGIISDRTQWHHVAITSQPGTNGWNFYQNGSLVASTTGDATISLAAIPKIGESQGAALNNFNGFFDDVRLYNRALSSEEIESLASGESGFGDFTLTFATGSTTTVNGALTLTGLDNDNRINLVSSELSTPWNLEVNGDLDITWVDVRDSHASGDSAPITHSNTLDSGGNENWGFDETAPTITNVTSDAANGTFGAGSVIDLDFTFSENVTTTGIITVALDSGGSCTFSGVTNSLTATCDYTILAGENSNDLSVSNLSGIIKDQSENQMTDFTPTTNLDNNKALVVDTTAPTITNVNSDKANGRYKAGEVIDIDLTFSKAVTSTGDVTVTLETGDTDRTCTFQATNSTTASCDYTVQAGDTSSDLTVSSISGTIEDQYGNAMTNFVPATNLAANKALVIDTTAPTITNATSNKANDTYGAGEVIDIDLTFSESVTSIGTVTVTLETGDTDRTCTFTVSSSSSASCNYTVQPGDSTADLDVQSISGTINDLAGNAMTNFVPTVSLATNKDIVIDASAPIITNISSDKGNGNYSIGEVIDIDLTFSTNVTSTGDVTVTLETGNTDRTCTFTVTNSSTASCDYTVQAGDTSSDLTVSLVAGTIADASSGVSMTDFVPSTNLAANKALIIDTTAPTITSITSNKSSGQYTTGEVIDIRVNFAEQVTSSETITVTLNTSPERFCTIAAFGVAASIKSCNYTVQEGDSTNESALSVDSIQTDGAITDLAGNEMADFSPAANLPASKTIIINTTNPVISNITSDTANGYYGSGTVIDIDFTFSQSVSGSLLITLETGTIDRTCTLDIPVFSETASCDYTVQPGDTSSDLAVSSVSGSIEDESGNPMTDFEPLVTLAQNKNLVIDTSAPGVSSFTPPDEGTALIASTPLYIRFNETVFAGTGFLTIRKADNSLHESIAIGGAQVTGFAGTLLTITPAVPFETLVSYYIQIDSTAILDRAGNPYAGISDSTTWNFTAGDFTLPVILSVSSTKTDGTYGYGTVIPLTVTFSEAVSSGLVTVTLETGDTDRACTFSVVDSTTGSCNYTVQAGDTSSDLDTVSISGSIEDQTGNAMQDFEPVTRLAFLKDLVIDTSAPAAVSFSPEDEAAGVSITTNLVITFTEDVVTAAGSDNDIEIRKANDDSLIETIDAQDSSVSGSGSSTITINPAASFEYSTAYYVLIGADVFDDLDGNSYEGVSASTTWNFSTAAAQDNSGSDNDNDGNDLDIESGGRRQESIDFLIAEHEKIAGEENRNTYVDGGERDDIVFYHPSSPSWQHPAIVFKWNRLTADFGDRQLVYRDIPSDSWYAGFIGEMIKEGIALGYKDEAGNLTGEYRPGNFVSLAEALKMGIEAAGLEAEEKGEKESWERPYVKLARERGIKAIRGIEDFSAPASRGLVFELLLELKGIDLMRAEDIGFTDLPVYHRFTPAIVTAVRMGWAEGDLDEKGRPKNTIRPDAPVNRAEMSKLVSLVLRK